MLFPHTQDIEYSQTLYIPQQTLNFFFALLPVPFWINRCARNKEILTYKNKSLQTWKTSG